LVVVWIGNQLHDDVVGRGDALRRVATLRPNRWYDPRYAIPFLGMILGNYMTGVWLDLNTLTTSLANRRAGVEA
jgi:ABC-type iron transport system FetAB permease component